MRKLVMLDLCSGFGGASESEQRNGWRVIRLDIEPRVHPDIVADIRTLPLAPFPVDLLWCSPPCTYYSRYDQRGLFPNEPEPSHELWRACETIIERWQPRFWLIENVRGATYFHGRPDFKLGPYHFWSNIPFMITPIWTHRKKHNLCSGTDPLRSAKRGYLPYPVSDAIRLSVENMLGVQNGT
jgi:site-specific DNA-cytosine methylase